jgi:hypothetical protein
MKIPFTWWLHDDNESFALHMEELLAKHDVPDAEELLQKIGRPFYEVVFECVLDTETGEVEVLKTTL